MAKHENIGEYFENSTYGYTDMMGVNACLLYSRMKSIVSLDYKLEWYLHLAWLWRSESMKKYTTHTDSLEEYMNPWGIANVLL